MIGVSKKLLTSSCYTSDKPNTVYRSKFNTFQLKLPKLHGPKRAGFINFIQETLTCYFNISSVNDPFKYGSNPNL